MKIHTDLVIPRQGEDPLDLLARCGGYYDCPIGADGKPKGPLVGYTARYDGEHHWVGFTYANFAKAEEHPPVVRYCSSRLVDMINVRLNDIDVFCGIPEGGKALAYDLAALCNRRHIFAEKEVLELKTAARREKSRIVFKRHQPRPGDRVVIVEDVCNNFDSTDQILAAVEEAGATVAALACFLNRSLKIDGEYLAKAKDQTERRIPIVRVVRKPIREYRQDAPEVAEQVKSKNVVWKPKDQWALLMTAMGA